MANSIFYVFVPVLIFVLDYHNNYY